MTASDVEVRGGAAISGYEQRLDELVAGQVASRIFAKDATLWGVDAEPEAAVRLGWVTPFERAETLLPMALQLREQLRERGIDRVVLCGMGGSSLGPEVVATWGHVPLTLLDSTHPDAVRRVLSGELTRTVVVVSSKSGSTVETRSHLAVFEQAFLQAGLSPAQHVVIVTDPNSALEAYAREQGYRCFLADPHVGGRFSVLTAFGVVPAVLAGADMQRVIADARAVQETLAADDHGNPALQLAASIMAGLPERYVLAVEEAPDARWCLGDWIEQLVAESTGKNGVGVLPIALPANAHELRSELPTSALRVRVGAGATPPAPEPDGLLVTGPLGAQLLLWETATAALGHLMKIDPFNQPDVESAKVAAKAALGAGQVAATDAGSIEDGASLLARLREQLPVGGYIALQVYLDRDGEYSAPAAQLRQLLAERTGAPVALGWGPRYLHSTGQLHKGGPALGLFLQVLDAAEPELEIPGSDAGFGALIRSQASGDRAVLRGHGRQVLTVQAESLARIVADLSAI